MKKFLCVVLALAMMFAFAACKEKPSPEVVPDNGAGDVVPGGGGIANPWREVSAEEAAAECGRLFKAPDGADNSVWRVLDDGEAGYKLVELTFEYEGQPFTARAQQGIGENDDISGLYYEWDVTDDATLANWGDLRGKTMRYLGEELTIDCLAWYDDEAHIGYELTTMSIDLDGFDILAVAESMYDPDKAE